MAMPQRISASRTITIDDYYSERFLRIEDKLKRQREFMMPGFEAFSRRFETMDNCFEAVDKRFVVLMQGIERFRIWSFAASLTFTGPVNAAMNYLK